MFFLFKKERLICCNNGFYFGFLLILRHSEGDSSLEESVQYIILEEEYICTLHTYPLYTWPVSFAS